MKSALNKPVPLPDLGRILLVEDEPTSMAILSSYLSSAGYEVTEAAHGLHAWEILQREHDFEIVVTDKRMPEMDGIELATRMKKDFRLRNIPVIIESGDTSQEEIQKGVRVGVFYYLAKPFEEETLMSLVRAAIADRRRNELFERRLATQRDALGTFTKGEFQIRRLEEAQNVAFLLGGLYPRPELAVTGLYELLLNAIEHGNLAIGFEEKNRLLAENKWEEEIGRRLLMSEYALRKVLVQFSQNSHRIEVLISDEGAGFDARPFMEIEPSRATQNSGRGIAKANLLSFDTLTYLGSGNHVQAVTEIR